MNVTKLSQKIRAALGFPSNIETNDSVLKNYSGENNREKRVQILLANPAFRSDRLSALSLEKVSELVPFSNGDFIIRENESDDDIFWLLKGKVEITREGKNIAWREPAVSIGEKKGMNPSRARSASVIAREIVITLKTKSSDLQTHFSKFPSLQEGLDADINQRHDQCVKRLVELSSNVEIKAPKGFTLAVTFASLAIGSFLGIIGRTYSSLPSLALVALSIFGAAACYMSFSIRHPRYQWRRWTAAWLATGIALMISGRLNLNYSYAEKSGSVGVQDPTKYMMNAWVIVFIVLIIATLWSEKSKK